MVWTYEMLLSLKEHKIKTSNDKNKTCRLAAQRLGSVKHEKRDKKNITFSQRCKTRQSSRQVSLKSKDKLYTD